ncbi:hypothetical protein H4R18_004402 [Coemansia javaensis]|uniref:Cytochrome b561 domain-containing protein n=1 Tax=Coemansia javaensis TaxID=2761396 RepID=A0A9W8H949_9FUNG|nr:hypothetical protein H4R18_004402 [Coemansia javaensis]
MTHSKPAVAEAGLWRQGRRLAEIAAGGPRALCSSALEATVSEIRSSGGWIQRIVQERRAAQHRLGHDASPMVPYAADVADSGSGSGRQSPRLAAPSFELDGALQMHQMLVEPPRRSSSDGGWRASGGGGGAQKPRPGVLRARRRRLCALLLGQGAVAAYLGVLCALPRPAAASPLPWHPALASVALVAATEGAVAAQHAPARAARVLRRCAHGLAGVTLLAGAALRIGGGRPASRRGAAHGAAGALALLLFAAQAALGAYAAWAGRAQRTEPWRRALERLALAAMWAGAWLGLRALGPAADWLWLGALATLAAGLLAPAARSPAHATQ